MNQISILAIDDNPSLRPVIMSALSGFGVGAIDFVNSGSDAVRLSIANSYDVMLVDNVMPHMSGLDFLRLRKEKIALDHTVVVIMAELPDDELLSACRDGEIPIDDVLVKPFSPQLVRERLRRVVERRNHPDRGAAAIRRWIGPSEQRATMIAECQTLSGRYLSCSLTVTSDAIIARLVGTLTIHDRVLISDLCDRVVKADANDVQHLVLDLSCLNRLDEYGVGCLVLLNALVSSSGKSMHLMAGSKLIRDQLEVTFINRIIHCGYNVHGGGAGVQSAVGFH